MFILETKMNHNCYFCNEEMDIEKSHYCPKCKTWAREGVIKRVNDGSKKLPSQELWNLTKDVFKFKRNKQTVDTYFRSHFEEGYWNWTDYDDAAILFIWLLDAYGFEVSRFYRKGKFVVRNRDFYSLAEFLINMNLENMTGFTWKRNGTTIQLDLVKISREFKI